MLNRIRHKVFASNVIVLLLSALLTGYAFFAITRVRALNEAIHEIDQIRHLTDVLRQQELEFKSYGYRKPELYNLNNPAIGNQVRQFSDSILSKLDDLLQQKMLEKAGMHAVLTDVRESVLTLQEQQIKLIDTYLAKGYKDWGAVGKLRQAIHQVEASDMQYDRSYMLMLRRNEKDFLLRNDISYLTKFKGSLSEMKTHLLQLQSDEQKGTIKDLIQKLDVYYAAFKNIVNLQSIIGMDENDGLNGRINTSNRRIGALIDQASRRINDYSDTVIQNYIMIFFTLFAGQIFISLLFSRVFAQNFSRRIIRIKDFIEQLASGKTTGTITAVGNDEIATTTITLEKLRYRLSTATSFANEIGKGNLAVEYDAQLHEGDLESSLITMQHNLRLIQEKEAHQAWIDRQLNEMTQVINEHATDVTTYSRKVINRLVKSLDINQGGLYVRGRQELGDQLILCGCVAYKRIKHVQQTCSMEDGLIGQCCKEQDMVYINQIPEGYIKITSGLGESTPSSLLLMPLVTEGEVFGVLELASFDAFEPHHQEIVRRVATQLAAYYKYALDDFYKPIFREHQILNEHD